MRRSKETKKGKKQRDKIEKEAKRQNRKRSNETA